MAATASPRSEIFATPRSFAASPRLSGSDKLCSPRSELFITPRSQRSATFVSPRSELPLEESHPFQVTPVTEVTAPVQAALASAGLPAPDSPRKSTPWEKQKRAQVIAPAETGKSLVAPAPRVRAASISPLTDFFRAVRHGHVEDVEKALSAGTDPNARDPYGNSPLIIACQNGNKRMVKALLRGGAVVDAQNSKGNTALHYCYAFNYTKLGEYLISKGASTQLLNNFGLTYQQGLSLDTGTANTASPIINANLPTTPVVAIST